jgi:hypothetical protein
MSYFFPKNLVFSLIIFCVYKNLIDNKSIITNKKYYYSLKVCQVKKYLKHD